MTDTRDEKQKSEKRTFVFNCSVDVDGVKYERGKSYKFDELEYQKVSRFVTLVKGVQ